MARLLRIYGLLFLLVFSIEAFGQETNDTVNRMADDFIRVSLVVCDPDDVLYSTLGHSALHLECPMFELDEIFTYEGENVRDEIWTFLKGELKMGLFALPPEIFLESYIERGRGVREYTINLDPLQEQKLWEVLDNRAAESLSLPYDYFHRGCAKALVQVMHEAIGKNAIHYGPWPEKFVKKTQREIVRDFITDAPWEEFFLYFLIGTEGDKRCPYEQKVIIPTDLVDVWQRATLDGGQPMLDSMPRVILEGTRHNEGTWCTPLFVSIVLLVLALGSLATLWTNNRTCIIVGTVIDYLLLVIEAIIGLVMTYLILFSDLPCTDWNWLIIPFNILPAIFWHWRKYWALPYAAIVFIWCIVMMCELFWGHVLMDWAHIILAFIFFVLLLKLGMRELKIERMKE